MPIELHCHSTASDGDCTPTELVDRALAIGITSLALTDHDTVDGVPEALEASLQLGGQVLRRAGAAEHDVARLIADFRGEGYAEAMEIIQPAAPDRSPGAGPPPRP